jgi:hypothetical protein
MYSSKKGDFQKCENHCILESYLKKRGLFKGIERGLENNPLFTDN